MSSKDCSVRTTGFRLGINDGTLGLIAAAIVLVGAVLWSADRASVEKTDFSLTYVGARIVHQGQGSHLYDLELQEQTRDSLFVHPVPILFEHPPFEALLLSPLAALPFKTAYRVWGLANAAVWLLLVIFLRPHLPWPCESLGYICLWVLFAPLAVALYQGQSSIILVALFAITFLQLKNGRDLSAGIALGFGLIKLQFAVPFALIFLIRRKWRFLGGFLLSAIFLTVLSIAAVGVGGIANYVKLLLTIASNPQDVSFGSVVDMPTIHGFLFALLGQRIDRTALTIVSAAISILLLAFVARRWRVPEYSSAADMSFAAAVACSLVTSSHMHTHDFSPLVLAMFLAGAHLREQATSLRIALMATLGLFWSGVVFFLCVAWHCLYLVCPVLLIFVYATAQAAKNVSRREISETEYVTA